MQDSYGVAAGARPASALEREVEERRKEMKNEDHVSMCHYYVGR